MTIVALAAQQLDEDEQPYWEKLDGSAWIRHSFPLVCKRWNAVFATQGRQPFARDAPSRLWEGDQVGEGGGEGGGGVGGGRAWHAPRPPPRHEGEAESQALLEAFKAKLLARNPNAEVLFH